MKSDNAVSLLTERSKRAERADQNWFILIENATRSRRINLGLASHARTCVRACMCVRAHPRSPNVYRIRGSVIITASHIRARAPEFIYSNLFTFTRNDSTTRCWPRPAAPSRCSYISRMQRRFYCGHKLLDRREKCFSFVHQDFKYC